MAIERFFIHDVAIRSAGTTAGRGSDTVLDWDDYTDVAATAWFEQVSTSDVRDTNSGDRTQWRMFTAATTEVRPGDRIVWGELLLRVIGRPEPAYSPDGEHHTEVLLELVEG